MIIVEGWRCDQLIASSFCACSDDAAKNPTLVEKLINEIHSRAMLFYDRVKLLYRCVNFVDA